ncbi:cyclase family protein [Microbacterium atlanticum]|uniref:cyclase family protein n=1 Tax=Microbacterium atlanticum TaxID=2782168 RepID=UPI0018890E82|nr:cyclase family protein [Microbacterium atlanticum]
MSRTPGGRVVDLSLTLAPELPASWPGALPFRHFVEHWFEEVADDAGIRLCGNNAPYRSHGLILDEHTGTHFDAPAHFLAHEDSGLPMAHPLGAITGDRVDPAQFIGPAAVIDITGLVGTAAPGRSPLITASVVRSWEDEHGEIAPGEIVLFRSGWDAHYVVGDRGAEYIRRPLERADTDAWPAPDVSAMEHLGARGVRCVGTDGASMGPAHDGAPTHVAGLSRGMVFVECLAGLDQLPTRGAQFIFLPVKVAHSAGGPGRAVAILP